MLSLAETEAQFRAAVVAPAADAPDMLRAPVAAAHRLEIYRRHYREALMRHISGRYPTVEWLLGSNRMRELAEPFVLEAPPASPCMAEYGGGFIAALKRDPGAGALAYIGDVAELDWMLGDVSVAIDRPALAISALAAYPADDLPDLGLRLQPGVRYMRSGWPIDDLVRVRLSDQRPETLRFGPMDVALEVTGARGHFRVGRIDPAAWRFRGALAAGETLGTATDQALALAPGFDPAVALAMLFAEGRVVEITAATED